MSDKDNTRKWWKVLAMALTLITLTSNTQHMTYRRVHTNGIILGGFRKYTVHSKIQYVLSSSYAHKHTHTHKHNSIQIVQDTTVVTTKIFLSVTVVDLFRVLKKYCLYFWHLVWLVG